MKTVLENIQNRLSTVSELKYIDENWGQLDDYDNFAPVKYPCALIEIGSIEFSHLGMDKKAIAMNRQMGSASIVISIATVKLTQTSFNAPKSQKDIAWAIWDILDNVHKSLHGYRPNENTSALMRTGIRRIKRDDGIQLYEITFSVSIHNA
jgi:hypothetical protein